MISDRLLTLQDIDIREFFEKKLVPILQKHLKPTNLHAIHSSCIGEQITLSYVVATLHAPLGTIVP